jgi:hypothetical protein
MVTIRSAILLLLASSPFIGCAAITEEPEDFAFGETDVLVEGPLPEAGPAGFAEPGVLPPAQPGADGFADPNALPPEQGQTPAPPGDAAAPPGVTPTSDPVTTPPTESTPPTTSSKVACDAGTTANSYANSFIQWDWNTGNATGDTTESNVSFTTEAGSSDPIAAAILTPWQASGRECLDVSAYTGVQFTISADIANDKVLLLKVGQSASYESGHCDTGCSAHPQAIITPGTNIKVPFSDLKPPTWGSQTPFNAEEVISLIWMTDDRTAGNTFSVRDVSFY